MFFLSTDHHNMLVINKLILENSMTHIFRVITTKIRQIIIK